MMAARRPTGCSWDTEVCLFGGASREEVVAKLRQVERDLAGVERRPLVDIAFTLGGHVADYSALMTIVASSIEDLRKKMAYGRRRLEDPDCTTINEIAGIYYFTQPLCAAGKVVFMYPGEGSQYPNMLADLCLHLPEVRAAFDLVDRAFVEHERGYLPSDFIFPIKSESAAAQNGTSGGVAGDTGTGRALWQMDVGTEAVFAASRALTGVLARLKIDADLVVGHSTGEYSALLAAGAIRMSTAEELVRHIRSVNRIYEEQARLGRIPLGVLLAAGGVDLATVRAIVDADAQHVHLAMDNCPHQIVLFGDEKSIERAAEQLKAHGALCERLPFDRAYHTALFAPICAPLAEFMERLDVVSPKTTVYSCCTAGPYPADPPGIRALAVAQWARPVRFRETIEQMYEAGGRVFIDVGPRGNLAGFVMDTLRGRPHVAVPLNVPHRSGTAQLQYALGLLAAHGVTMDLDYLYTRRASQRLEWGAQLASDGAARHGSRGIMQLAVTLPELAIDSLLVRGDGPVSASGKSAPRDETPVRSPKPPTPMSGPSDDAGLQRLRARQGGTPLALPEMTEYLRTMETFLEAQRTVITAYFERTAGHLPSGRRGEPVSRTIPAGAATVDGLVGPARAPTSLSRSSVTSVMTASLTANAPTARPATDMEEAPTRPRDDSKKPPGEILLQLLSEKTGYPAEMLGLDLALEADLGVNSITRIEILGVLQRRIGRPSAEELERVSRARTVREMLRLLAMDIGEVEQTVGATSHETCHTTHTAGEIDAVSSAPSERKVGPFVGTVVAYVPGEEVLAVRTFKVEHDRFIRDHTLGGRISVLDADLLALPVMPLSISIEMMAEVAALLQPERVVTAITDVRANGWITLEREETTLQVRARSKGRRPPSVQVEIRVLDDAPGSPTMGIPVVEGIVQFADGVQPGVDAGAFGLREEHASTWTPDRLYTEGLFNGPSFRTVASIERCGSDGAVAMLNSLPTDGLVRGAPQPQFLADPLLVDGAGQVVGFWSAEHLDRGFVIFPFEVRDLSFHGTLLPTGATAECRARLTSVEDRVIESDIDVVDTEGRLRLRASGWRDRRFDISRDFASFVLSPARVTMSEPYALTLSGVCAAEDFECRLAHGWFETLQEAGSIWRQVLAHLILGRAERQVWQNLPGTRRRRDAWLLGRLAAKDAVRVWLQRKHGIVMLPADIEIEPDAHGRPTATCRWTKSMPAVPRVSIAHTGDAAIAVAGDTDACIGIGVDIELLGQTGGDYERVAFIPAERALLSRFGRARREEWGLRFWCAKEAVAKALGQGLLGGPQCLIVEEVSESTGEVRLSVHGELCQPALENLNLVTAITARMANRVTAMATIKAGDQLSSGSAI